MSLSRQQEEENKQYKGVLQAAVDDLKKDHDACIADFQRYLTRAKKFSSTEMLAKSIIEQELKSASTVEFKSLNEQDIDDSIHHITKNDEFFTTKKKKLRIQIRQQYKDKNRKIKENFKQMLTNFGLSDDEKVSIFEKIVAKHAKNKAAYDQFCREIRSFLLQNTGKKNSSWLPADKLKEFELEALLIRVNALLNKKNSSRDICRQRFLYLIDKNKEDLNILRIKHITTQSWLHKLVGDDHYCLEISPAGKEIIRLVMENAGKIKEQQDIDQALINSTRENIISLERTVSLLHDTLKNTSTRIINKFKKGQNFFKKIANRYEQLNNGIAELQRDYKALNTLSTDVDNEEKALNDYLERLEEKIKSIGPILAKLKGQAALLDKIKKDCTSLAEHYGYKKTFDTEPQFAQLIELAENIRAAQKKLEAEKERTGNKIEQIKIKNAREKEKENGIPLYGQTLLQVCKSYTDHWEQECRAVLTPAVLEKLMHGTTNPQVITDLFVLPLHLDSSKKDYHWVRDKLINLLKIAPRDKDIKDKRAIVHEILFAQDPYVANLLLKFRIAMTCQRALQSDRHKTGLWTPRINFVFAQLKEHQDRLAQRRFASNATPIIRGLAWAGKITLLFVASVIFVGYFSKNLYRKLFYTTGENFIDEMSSVKKLTKKQLEEHAQLSSAMRNIEQSREELAVIEGRIQQISKQEQEKEKEQTRKEEKWNNTREAYKDMPGRLREQEKELMQLEEQSSDERVSIKKAQDDCRHTAISAAATHVGDNEEKRSSLTVSTSFTSASRRQSVSQLFASSPDVNQRDDSPSAKRVINDLSASLS